MNLKDMERLLVIINTNIKPLQEKLVGVNNVMGVVSSFIASLFGGWYTSLQTLTIFMVIDFITGLFIASLLKKSGKSENKSLDGKVGWKGLCRKGMTLLIVFIAHRLDLTLKSSFIMDAVIIGYIVNEAISIIENAGIMGLPIPSVFTKSIDFLKRN